MTTVVEVPKQPSAVQTSAPLPREEVVIADIENVRPSPTNPRKRFGGIEDLAQSIREHGILQPMVARQRGTNGGSYYELIFGERRLRAAKLAGLARVPLLIRDMNDKQTLEAQVIENLQREDVDPLDEADGYR